MAPRNEVWLSGISVLSYCRALEVILWSALRGCFSINGPPGLRTRTERRERLLTPGPREPGRTLFEGYSSLRTQKVSLSTTRGRHPDAEVFASGEEFSVRKRRSRQEQSARRLREAFRVRVDLKGRSEKEDTSVGAIHVLWGLIFRGCSRARKPIRVRSAGTALKAKSRR